MMLNAIPSIMNGIPTSPPNRSASVGNRVQHRRNRAHVPSEIPFNFGRNTHLAFPSPRGHRSGLRFRTLRLGLSGSLHLSAFRLRSASLASPVRYLLCPLLTSAPRSGCLATPSVLILAAQISRDKLDRLHPHTCQIYHPVS